jgi:predicted nucleotidyltransferase
MPNHNLSAFELGILLDILAPYAERIERVGLFGSRATGTARPNSDIDMVFHGDIDEALVDRLWTLFDESNLPIKVDVLGYDLIPYPPIKQHIDAVEQTLFTQADLLAHKARVQK